MGCAVSVPVEIRPAGMDPDSLYEVIGSRVVEKPPMGAHEGGVASLLLIALGSFTHTNGLGKVVSEVLVLLDASRNLKRRPDLAFVSYERWPRDQPIPYEEAWDVVPDLAVEVNSKSNTGNELLEKIEEYFQAGVRLVWVLYPAQRKAYVYQSATKVEIIPIEGELDGGAVVPHFRLPLLELFEVKTPTV